MFGGSKSRHIPQTAALLTSRCISGHSCRSHRAKFRTEAIELRSTSPSRRQASFEAACISSRARCPRSWLRQARITRAPRRASSWDTTFPMPVGGQLQSRLVWEVIRGQWSKWRDRGANSGYCFSPLPSLLRLLGAEAPSEATGWEKHSPLLAPVTTAVFPVRSVEQCWRSQS